MKRCVLLPVLSAFGLYATMASALDIISFDSSGVITWTNSISNATYRVEWASTITGRWFSSWQGQSQIETHTTTVASAAVPLFYRISVISNYPAGMVSVDGGSFLMGDSYNEGLNTERPAHNVFVSAFWIDRFEVSKAMWDRVTSWAITNGYVFQNTGAGQANNHPVQMLNWYDIVKWCNARSEMDGLLPVYFTDSAQTSIYRNAQIDLTSDAVAWDRNGYRLPTEAEWEKAARGGLKGHHFPWPSYGGAYSAFIDGTKANFVSSGDPFESGTTPYTTPVGYYNGSQSPAGIDMGNGFGLYDMAGNLWEYCWDWYQDYWYSDAAATQDDPTGPSNSPYYGRVLRGGSWDGTYGGTESLRCARRFSVDPSYTRNRYGFRCVRRN